MTPSVFTRQWLFLGVSLLILGGFIAINLFEDHQRIDIQERERLAALADTVAKNIAPQVVLADHIITNIMNALPSWQAENDGLKRANRELKIINDTINGIPPLLVMDASGSVVISSDPKLLGMNFSYREYFRTAIKTSDQRVLQVSAPFRTVLNDFAFTLSRTIRGPAGEFAGVVVVTEVPAYFKNLLDSVRYAPDVRTSIVHGDGMLFLSSPYVDSIDGMDLAKPGTFFTRHRESGQQASIFTGIVYSTGDERVIAHHTVQLPNGQILDKPLVVAVGRKLDAIYASWYRDAFVMAGLFVALLLVSAFGMLFYQRKQKVYDRLVDAQEEERKRSVAELHDKNTELERSNADLEQFAYVASHDLQTPLRNIVRYAQLLAHRYEGQLGTDADDFIGFIVDGGKQMTRLINDLLEFSRASLQSEPLRPISAGEAVAQALKNLELDVSKAGAEVIVGDLPVVMADQTYLASLFQNLLGNGIKYRAPDRKPVLSVSAERVSFDCWRFAVADNGIGIEPQYHDKIFEIFQRLDPTSNADGTGIGLTLCRRIVHRFGGTIWLKSEHGTGTTFFFTLRDGAIAT